MINKNRTIDLYEMFWEAAVWWRPILIIILVLSFLCLSMGYRSNMSEYKKRISQSSRETFENEDQILEGLSEDERADVEFALELREKIKAFQIYSGESLLMQIDPNNYTKVVESLYIKVPEGGNANAACRAYNACMYDQKVVKKLGKALGLEDGIPYFNEIMSDSLTGPTEQTSASIWKCEICIPDGMNAKALSKALHGCIVGQIQKKVKASVDHELTYINSEVYNTSGEDISSKQNTQLSNVNSQKQNLQTRTGAFSSKQNDAYNAVISLESDDGDKEGEAEDSSDIEKPGFFSLKYALAGVFLGVFLCAIALLFRNLFSGKIYYVSDIESCGAGCIGQVWKRDQSKGAGGVLFDKNLYRIHHRSSKNEVSDSIRLIIKKLDAAGLREISVVPAQDGVSEFTEEFIRQLRQKPKYKINVIENAGDEDAMDEGLIPAAGREGAGVLIIAHTGRGLRRIISRAVSTSELYDIESCCAVLADY